MMTRIGILSAICAAAWPVLAQTGAPASPPPVPAPAPEAAGVPAATPAPALVSLTPRAQVKLRPEVVGDRQLGGAPFTTPINQRVRLGLAATAGDLVGVVVEVQDVRVWGAEVPQLPTLPPDPTVYGTVPGSLDLFVGYASVHLEGVELRLGRQDIAISNERLIGALDWAMRGRVFDAARLLYKDEHLQWTLWSAVIADKDGASTFGEQSITGAAAEWKLLPELRLSPIAVWDVDWSINRHRGTVGARADGSIASFAYDVEAYGQASAHDSAQAFAGMVAARASYGFDVLLKPRVGVLCDALSGNADSAATTGVVTFNTLYGTNHKFYGYQDLFLNIPLHTKNHGLVDAAVTAALSGGPLALTAAGHLFSASAYGGPGSPLYGFEPDVVVSYKPVPQAALEAGWTLFVPVGDALGRGTTTTPFGYLQLMAQL